MMMWGLNASRANMKNGTFSEEGLVSLSLRNKFLQVNGCILLVMGFAGLANNILNMKAFHGLGFNVGSNASFFALSASNFACACLRIVLAVITLDTSSLIRLSMNLSAIEYIIRPFVVCISAFASGVIVLINVERCCCVIMPTTFREYFTRNRSRAFIAVMLIVQIVVMATNLAPVSFRVISTNSTGRPRVVLNISEMDIGFVELLSWGGNLPIVICFVVIFLSTILLVIALKQRNRWLQGLDGSQSVRIAQNERLICTAVAISIAYLICYLPRIIGHFRVLLSPRTRPQMFAKDNFTYVTVSFIRIFHALPGTFDSLIYMMTNAAFKTYAKKFVSCNNIRRCRNGKCCL